jgi:hypothetical protein
MNVKCGKTIHQRSTADPSRNGVWAATHEPRTFSVGASHNRCTAGDENLSSMLCLHFLTQKVMSSISRNSNVFCPELSTKSLKLYRPWQNYIDLNLTTTKGNNLWCVQHTKLKGTSFLHAYSSLTLKFNAVWISKQPIISTWTSLTQTSCSVYDHKIHQQTYFSVLFRR